MKTKLIILFIFSLISNLCLSQNPKVEMSPELPEKGGYTILGQHKDKILCLRFRKESCFIESYSSKNFTPELSQKLKFKTTAKEKLNYEFAFMNDNEVVVLASHYRKSEEMNILFFSTYDMNGSQTNSWEEVAKIQGKNKRVPGQYHFQFSSAKKVLLVYSDIPQKNSEKKTVNIFTFDKAMTLLSSKDIELDTKEKSTAVDEFNVDNSGNVFFIAHKPDNSRSDRYDILKAKEDITDHVIISFNKENNDYKIHPLKIDGKTIIQAKIAIDSLDQVHIAGLCKGYTEEPESKFFDVFNTTLLKKTLEPNEIKICPTYTALKNKIGSYDKSGNTQWVIRSMHALVNGENLLVLEKQWSYESCTTDPKTGAMTCKTKTRFDDILCFAINSNGEIAWYNAIARAMSDVTFSALYSIHSFTRKSNLNVVFNLTFEQHIEENLKQSSAKFNRKTRHSYLSVVATIDSKGKMTFTPIHNTAEIKRFMYPGSTTQLEPNVWLFEIGRFNKRGRFAKMKF